MEREIHIKQDNWLNYANAVGDYNPIHRSDDEAKHLGLERAIAPGMFIASHIQGNNLIGSLESIKFSGPVYNGDILIMSDLEKKGSTNYTFKKSDGKKVCEVIGVSNQPINSITPVNNLLHTYQASPLVEDIHLFLNSIGFPNEKNPEMYLASLSAPALLDFGHKHGLVGVHVSQSFSVFGDCVQGTKESPNLIYITIGDLNDRGRLQSYELRWFQNNRIIASGKSVVMPIKI